MKFRDCPAHFLRKLGIPTLSKSIPTLRTEFISSLFHLYNSRIVRYNSRIGGQSRNSYFAQVHFWKCTDSYFAQNIYAIRSTTRNVTIKKNGKFLVYQPGQKHLFKIIFVRRKIIPTNINFRPTINKYRRTHIYLSSDDN